MITTPLSVEQTYEEMRVRLKGLAPEFELRHKAELAVRINRLKEEKNAIILGHNYMEAALYTSVTDFRGDSLELCRRAQATDKDIIVFCGVQFMAETAKILNPEKTVLIPSQKAGCSLADSITAEDVRELKRRYPGVPVISYVNTSAKVKAESDYCCTSANAARVVNAVGSDTVIFLPDEYLARNVAHETGKTIVLPDLSRKQNGEDPKNLHRVMLAWRGRCEVHEKFTVEDVTNVRRQFPDVVVVAHPECSPEVVAASDFSGSTSGIIKYVKEHLAPHYLILTECAMGDNIIAENPDRDVLRLCSVRCPHMNQITMEDTLEALQKNQYEVDVPEDIRDRARLSIERMLEIV